MESFRPPSRILGQRRRGSPKPITWPTSQARRQRTSTSTGEVRILHKDNHRLSELFHRLECAFDSHIPPKMASYEGNILCPAIHPNKAPSASPPIVPRTPLLEDVPTDISTVQQSSIPLQESQLLALVPAAPISPRFSQLSMRVLRVRRGPGQMPSQPQGTLERHIDCLLKPTI